MTSHAAQRLQQDERFFFLLQQLAGKGVAAAARLHRLIDDYAGLESAVADVRQIEHEADGLVLELQSRLHAARVTPFDREDIDRLTACLDDVVDHTEAAVDRLMIFHILEPTPALRRLADALLRCTVEVEAAIRTLIVHDVDARARHCHGVNEIENEADQILRDALSALFSGEIAPLEVMKWKEVYDLVEAATDACEDVADVIETAARKAA